MMCETPKPKIYHFQIGPKAKPRMVRSDKWRKRDCVESYWAWKDELNIYARIQKYKVKEELNIRFEIEMSESWSEKKKLRMKFQPHKQKPDIDNLIKAFLDALLANDANIWKVTAEKVWSDQPGIFVYEQEETI